jgi:hypothetical protein
MQMKLEFDTVKGYGDFEIVEPTTLDDYLGVPVIAWCHGKIGNISWPRDPNEVLQGDGWEISADWQDYLNYGNTMPRVYVIITKPVDQRLLTEFWIRFSP